jgi:hypothetical protein
MDTLAALHMLLEPIVVCVQVFQSTLFDPGVDVLNADIEIS